MKRLMTTIAAAFLIALAMDASAQTAPTKSRNKTVVKQKEHAKAKTQGEPKVAADKQEQVQQGNSDRTATTPPPVKRNKKLPNKVLKTKVKKAERPAQK